MISRDETYTGMTKSPKRYTVSSNDQLLEKYFGQVLLQFKEKTEYQFNAIEPSWGHLRVPAHTFSIPDITQLSYFSKIMYHEKNRTEKVSTKKTT